MRYRKLLDLILYLIVPIYIYRGWTAAKNNPQYCPEKAHNAIIVAHGFKLTKPTAYADGIDLLIEHFLKNKMPYKVYHCHNPEEFKVVLKNKKATRLWIFGHGCRHCLGFSGLAVTYCEVKDYPKKEYIAQLHCNPGAGKSLAEYLVKNPKNRFVEGTYRHIFRIRRDIKKILKKAK